VLIYSLVTRWANTANAYISHLQFVDDTLLVRNKS
jgi:hypothetical protein